MKIDLYTKAVLTVIAMCLVAIVLRDVPIVGEAHAQRRGTAGPKYDQSGALHVVIANQPIKVKTE